MSINDPRCPSSAAPTVYQMQNTRIVDRKWNTQFQTSDSTVTNDELIGQIAAVARGLGGLEFLIINCHGRPGVLAIADTLSITDTPKFAALAGLIRRGILMTSCGVANSTVTPADLRADSRCSDGKIFCAEMARYAKCRVFAGEQDQHSVTQVTPTGQFLYPFGFVDYFEGPYFEFVPPPNAKWITHTDPSHTSIDEWNDFKSKQWWGEDKTEMSVPTFGRDGWESITTGHGWPHVDRPDYGPWGF